jgi:drug/metabolite transporter (DMT)-like permease
VAEPHPTTTHLQRLRPVDAVLLALASALAAAAGAVVGKLGVAETSRPVYLLWMFGFSTLAAAALWPLRRPASGRRITRRGLGLLVAHALLGCLGCWGWYEGLTHLQAGTAAFVGRAEVLVMIAVGVVLLGERLRAPEIVGGLLGIAGVVLMSLEREGGPPDRLQGVAFVLLGSLGFGVGELFAKRSVGEVDPGTFVLVRSALMFTFFAGWAALGAAPWLPSPRALLSAAGVAILGPLLARSLYMHALQGLALSRAALLAQTQPLFVALLAFGVLGTWPGPLEWVGGLLLAIGSALIVWNARPRPAG